MVTFQYTIKDAVRIHARPAGALVQEAKKYPASIMMKTEKGNADVKKLLAIMSLGIKQGEEITIEVSGEGEEAAATAIQEFLKANL